MALFFSQPPFHSRIRNIFPARKWNLEFKNNLPSVFLVFFLVISNASGNPLQYDDVYPMIDAFLNHKLQPRLLNSQDVNINPKDPQPLFSPEGDFDNDGYPELAISGLYRFPDSNKKYFLLIATKRTNPFRYQKLFFEEYEKPVFLHAPGTTGDGDLNDQAFSISFCYSCSDGIDFLWDQGEKTFHQRKWDKHIRRYQPLLRKPDKEPVPDDVIENVLKVVGVLPDITKFVSRINTQKSQLVTRVESTRLNDPGKEVNVFILEKKGNREIVYDVIKVETKNGKILSRRLRIK